jgi:hypothetical protein
MKVLKDGIFVHREAGRVRLWHTCEKYKKGKRGTTRPELQLVKDNFYKCPHCDFEYILDNVLKPV